MMALGLGLGLRAQCPLTEAVDFTATDIHGTEVHLFDILDGGQYVLIDFFFTTCGPCQTATPKIVSSYYSFGCNMHDVFYIEISDRDSNAACLNWVNNFGVEYPTISGAAGGSTICNQFQIGYFPTIILIKPDRQIVIQDLWPINNAQTIITALENQGVEQHACGSSPEVTISIDLVTETEVTATFTPNEDCASYAYTIATESEIEEWMSMTGLALPEYLWTYGIPGSETISNTFNGLTPETEYTLFAVPADLDGNLGEVVQETVTTTNSGGDDIMPDFTGTDIHGNVIHLYDLLDAGQAAVLYFFHSDYAPCATLIPYVTKTYSAFGCNQHDVFFMEISSYDHDNTCQTWTETYDIEFPTISRDGGGNAIAQSIPVAFYPTVMIIRPDHTIAIRDLYPIESSLSIIHALENEGYQQYNCPTNVDEHSQSLTISPNPANNVVTLKGENLGTVQVYNALGQMIDEFEANGDELRFNTSGYDNGVYFIKTGETSLRFLVTH